MAKRKKINRRVLILLIVLGVLVVAGGAAFFISRMEPDVNTLVGNAKEFSDKGNHEEAAMRYARAAKMSGKPEYWYLCAQENLKLFEDASLSDTKRMEKRRDAYTAIQNALRENPKYVEAQELLCEMDWSINNWADFLKNVDRLIEISPEDNPKNHLYYYRRGFARAYQAKNVRGGLEDEAIADIKKAIELKPDELLYRRQLIMVLSEFKKDEDVENAFIEALEAMPDSAELRSQYASFLWGKDRKDEAIKQLEEARNRQPDSAISYITKANILLSEPNEENREKAMEALQFAKKAEPGNPGVYLMIYQILLNERKTEEAVKELREGLAATEKRLDDLGSDEANAATVRSIRNGKFLLLYNLTDSLLDSMRESGETKPEVMEEARRYLDKLAAYGDTPQKMVLEGRIMAREGKLPEAVEMLEKGCELLEKRGNPLEYVDNSLELFTLYIRQGRPRQAETLLDQILEKYPTPGVLIAKAKLLVVNQRNYDEAERYLRRALEGQKDNAEAMELLTEINILRGTLDPGKVELTPGTISSIINRAKQAMASGRVEQATLMLEKLHERIPDDLNVTRELAGVYVTRGMTDQAEKLVQTVLDTSKDPKVVSEFEYMRDMLREKDPEKKFQMMMARADEVENPVDRALHKAVACEVFRKEEDYVKYLKEAQTAGPDDPRPVVLLFSYALSKKNWEMAEEYLEIIKQKNFDSTNGEQSKASLEIAKGSYDKAISILDALLAEHPQMKRVRVMLGQCYLDTNKLEEAKEAFQTVVDNDPNFGGAIAVIGMAQVTERMQDAEEHWKWVRMAQKMAPDNPYVREQVAVLQEIEAKKEDLPALIARREQVMKQSPENIDNRVRLAGLYLRNGQPEKAGEIYAFLYDNTDGKNKLFFAKLLAAVYLDLGRKNDIDKLFADLLSKTDEKSEAYRLYGTLLQGYDPERAEKVFEQAVLAAPDDYRPYISLAGFYHATGRLDDAIDALQKALKNRQDENGRRNIKKDLINLMLLGDWKKYNSSIETYVNSLLSDAPDDISSLALKAGFLYKQAMFGDQKNRDLNLERAEDAATKAIQINRDYVLAYNQRARIYAAMGNWASAKADLQTAFDLCKTPDSVWAGNGPAVGMELVALDEKLDNLDSATETCKSVLANYPDYLQAEVVLIRLYFAQKKWDKAEEQIRAASAKYPENWIFPLYEAQMWRSRNEMSRATDAYARAYKLAPKMPTVVSEYLNVLLDTKNFQQTLDFSKEYAGQDGFVGWIEAMQARANVGLGNSAEGETLFKEAIKKVSPSGLPLVVSQIRSAYGVKDAAARLDEWQNIRPSDAMLRIYLAGLYRDADEFDKSVEALKKALELSLTPESKAAVLIQMGGAYHMKGMIQEAKDAYLKCLEYGSQNVEALNNLAYLYVDNLDDPDSAFEYAQKAIQILPNEPNILDTYGWVLAKQGKHREAQEVFVRGLKRKPSAALHYHYGWSLEQTQNLGDALTQYEQGFELVKNKQDDPFYDKLKESIQRVKKELE